MALLTHKRHEPLQITQEPPLPVYRIRGPNIRQETVVSEKLQVAGGGGGIGGWPGRALAAMA
jgi:hypothetical protein